MSTSGPIIPDAALGESHREPRLRFPKAARLFRAAEFGRVKSDGRSFHGRYMLLGVLKGQGEDLARTGIITSRRVGSAVVRNGVRRRIREIVRHARPQLNCGVWMVIVAKSAASKAEYAQLRDDWTQLARKAGIVQA